VDVSAHVRDRLPLLAAGALDPGEEAAVRAHLAQCVACADAEARWRALADGLRELGGPAPDTGLLARTREAAARRIAERAEEAWNRRALGFLIVFAWVLTGGTWLVIELVVGTLALHLGRSPGSTALWFGAYVAAGFVTATAAAVLLGRQAREEGRMA
jgi:anti-sigma factor RsiW